MIELIDKLIYVLVWVHTVGRIVRSWHTACEVRPVAEAARSKVSFLNILLADVCSDVVQFKFYNVYCSTETP